MTAVATQKTWKVLTFQEYISLTQSVNYSRTIVRFLEVVTLPSRPENLVSLDSCK
ncbi:hypothetical protein SK128_024411, partial [Halocaridina rubra]